MWCQIKYLRLQNIPVKSWRSFYLKLKSSVKFFIFEKRNMILVKIILMFLVYIQAYFVYILFVKALKKPASVKSATFELSINQLQWESLMKLFKGKVVRDFMFFFFYLPWLWSTHISLNFAVRGYITQFPKSTSFCCQVLYVKISSYVICKCT